MIKLGIVLLIIVIILIGVTVILNTCGQDSTEIPKAELAKYKVTADNRVYFTDEYSQGVDKFGEYVSLNGYWTEVDSTWKYVNQPLYLSYRGYKNILIEER